MAEEDFVITMKDVRAAHHCSAGARAWFKLHGLDWSDFLRNGIAASKMLATNDALGVRLVEFVKNRRNG